MATTTTGRRTRRDRRHGRPPHVVRPTGFTHLDQERRATPSGRQLVGLCLVGLVLAAIGAQVGGFGSYLFEERWLARAEIQYRGTAWTETQDVAIRSRSLLGPIAADVGEPIKEFEERLEARLIPGTQILRVDYTSTDPDLARTVVSELANRYIDITSELTPAEIRATLLDEMAEIEAELAVEQEKFDRIATSTDIRDQPEQQATQAVINSLRARLDDVQSRILDHDIQTIDESENGIPIVVTEPFVFEEQVFPRPKIFAAVGGAVGLLLAGLYAGWFWNRLSWRAERRSS
ncbi:MAG: hypothetical protein AAF531_00485 [Actinomycetota bacterium]